MTEAPMLTACAAMAIAGFYMLFCENPVKSAFALLFIFILTATLYLLAGLYLAAAIQVIIYAGGVMVLFAVAISATPGVERGGGSIKSVLGFSAVFAAAAFYLVLRSVSAGTPRPEKSLPLSTVEIAKKIFYSYPLQFELVSVLILGSIIAAAVLMRKKK